MLEYKFYLVSNGCEGFIGKDEKGFDAYQLFSTEDEYREWYEENK
jgi:hypothetical protein